MTRLMRATDVLKRPVVTLGGDAIAQLMDVVYEASKGEVAGFTLADIGLFAGPRKDALAWGQVHGFGRDAVIVADADVFQPRRHVVERASGGGGGDVLGSRVLTESGADLGEVVDVILQVGESLDVVGYEVKPSKGKPVFLPLPSTVAASVDSLVVSDATVEFISDDLAGFGAAVAAFRAKLTP